MSRTISTYSDEQKAKFRAAGRYLVITSPTILTLGSTDGEPHDIYPGVIIEIDENDINKHMHEAIMASTSGMAQLHQTREDAEAAAKIAKKAFDNEQKAADSERMAQVSGMTPEVMKVFHHMSGRQDSLENLMAAVIDALGNVNDDMAKALKTALANKRKPKSKAQVAKGVAKASEAAGQNAKDGTLDVADANETDAEAAATPPEQATNATDADLAANALAEAEREAADQDNVAPPETAERDDNA